MKMEWVSRSVKATLWAAFVAVQSCTPAYAGTITPLIALSTTVTQASPGSGQIVMIYCWNPNAAVTYIQVFDATSAASVALGTTTANLGSYGIPPTSSSGFTIGVPSFPALKGIYAAATTTAGGNTAPGTAMDCDIAYQ